jgi:hypothetical protein
MLRNAILNEESGEALKARHPQERNAGALKAREAATTLEGPATKRPRRADSYENVEFEENFSGENDESFMIDDEDGQAQSASRWQASEELSSFLDTIRKPLSSFERKIIGMYKTQVAGCRLEFCRLGILQVGILLVGDFAG